MNPTTPVCSTCGKEKCEPSIKNPGFGLHFEDCAGLSSSRFCHGHQPKTCEKCGKEPCRLWMTGCEGYCCKAHRPSSCQPKEEAKGERCEIFCEIHSPETCGCSRPCLTHTPTNPKSEDWEEKDLKKALDEAFKNLPAGVFYGHHSDVAWSIAHALAPLLSRQLAEARREQHRLTCEAVEKAMSDDHDGSFVPARVVRTALDRVKPESRKE